MLFFIAFLSNMLHFVDFERRVYDITTEIHNTLLKHFVVLWAQLLLYAMPRLTYQIEGVKLRYLSKIISRQFWKKAKRLWTSIRESRTFNCLFCPPPTHFLSLDAWSHAFCCVARPLGGGASGGIIYDVCHLFLNCLSLFLRINVKEATYKQFVETV